MDDTTPTIGSIRFERVRATDCEGCVGYILGLPERPVREIVLKDCEFSFNLHGKPMVPAMAAQVEECFCQGLIARYVDSISVSQVKMEGLRGKEKDFEHCGENLQS